MGGGVGASKVAASSKDGASNPDSRVEDSSEANNKDNGDSSKEVKVNGAREDSNKVVKANGARAREVREAGNDLLITN